MKLLVVDDSNVMRRKISRAVESIGISNVVQAANGIEALALYKLEQPTMVTMDLTMPEMDGLACIKAIIEIDPNALILVISALSDRTATLEALDAGARAFIRKPFDDDELNAELRKLLAEQA